ncbi:MAG: hypothetical protein BGO38_17795 [Cellulomonas sp. 73-145]|nr:hypothetical protein [Cellulomonas sp. 73-145]MBN9328111.1 hypothetical protein [Cellulomonas sp.]OJV59121.1 MAG: hypothetical protein BGO38_17795 [Cellulomonas sp. 73-145]
MYDASGASLASPGGWRSGRARFIDTRRAFGVARRSRTGPMAVRVALLTIAALIAVGGCSQVGGAGTFTVCGQTLFTASDTPAQFDVSSGPTRVHTSGIVLLGVSAGCTHGVDVTVIPASTQVVSRAKAKDGRTAAIVLKLDRLSVRLTITRPDGVGYYVWVFDEPAPSSSPPK